ncbi:MAG: hypothetical protein II337_07415 [Clostridia bacterium]|nr:hypothetical protein [Clostridia bacterium]
MKKIKLSLAEKKLLKTVIALILIQFAIVLILTPSMNPKPIGIEDTKQIDITVDDIYYFKFSKGDSWFVVVSDSTRYIFIGRPTFEGYSVSELYRSIHKGDKLSLMYRETYNILGRVNLVVDARSGSEIYRTIEEYNVGAQYTKVFVAILFSIIEIVFIGIIFVYVWLNHNVIKGFYRKIKKHLVHT